MDIGTIFWRSLTEAAYPSSPQNIFDAKNTEKNHTVFNLQKYRRHSKNDDVVQVVPISYLPWRKALDCVILKS